MYSKLLIPLDGSRLSEGILPYARTVAKAWNATAELLQVIDPDAVSAMTDSQVGRYVDTVEAAMKTSSSDYLQGIARSLTGLTVSCAVEIGAPAEVIVDRAASSRDTLIAMSTHGRSGVQRWVLGSVAEKVLQACTNPLLLVRTAGTSNPNEEAALKTILVPLDGSSLAEIVLPHAAATAREMELEVVLVRVFSMPTQVYSGEGYVPDIERLVEGLKKEAADYLDKKAQQLRADGLNRVSCLVPEGEAAEQIIDLARRTPDNLVAMCTHGRSGIGRWVLGSVTDRVVRHSGDPVLVIRSSEKR